MIAHTQSSLRAASSAVRNRWPSLPVHVSSSTRCRRCQCSVHTATDTPSHYYDSQSGRHVPIHDESKITAYYYPTGRSPTSATAILDGAKSLCLASALILNNVEDMSKALSFGGTVFISSQLVEEERADDVSNINLCFDLDAYEIADDKAAFEKNMSTAAQTSIGLFAPKYFTGEVDPVLTASATASLMDATGGGDFILLSPRMTGMDENCGDGMVQLCEELSYLDVEGSTIKSRLIVSTMDDDQVEECLLMGISKYFVGDEMDLNMLRNIVQDQGKELILN